MSENHQEISLLNREQLEIKGVEEVINYDDSEINLVTNQGSLLISGEDLDIEHLDVNNLDLKVTGKIIQLEYDPGSRVQGFFQRLFK